MYKIPIFIHMKYEMYSFHDFLYIFKFNEFFERAHYVSRLTATGYLNALVEAGFLEREKRGRVYYYINKALRDIAGGA